MESFPGWIRCENINPFLFLAYVSFYDKAVLRQKWVSKYFEVVMFLGALIYEGWNFNSGNYFFTTDTK